MKEELLAKLRKINPIDSDGIPKNKGNCQWCAIEGARVLLESVEPREIPSFEDGCDPIEERVRPRHANSDLRAQDPKVLFEEIQKLNVGELMLVSLESEDLDHAYIIYKDADDIYLIDPDRQIFVELDEREDFMQKVKGWDDIEKINYLNGDLNSDFRSKIRVGICVLSPNAVARDPLPEYGTEPESSYRYS